MRFDPRFLDELRDRVALGDLVGRRVKLARAGRELKGLCPFHTEKTPSFHVVEDKNFYHCFGCGAHGDAFSFLTEMEGLSFPEAVEQLASQAGMELPKPDPEARRRAEQQADLHEVVEAATRFFQEQLGRSAGRDARTYLDGRGVSELTRLDFRLGLAPDSRTALKDALTARGIGEDAMIEAGLLIKPEAGGASYDRFRHRIIFPITDRKGRVIAFGGRALGDSPAKYLNSPDTPLFHKGRTLYNLAGARKPAHDAGTAVVVEGYMDVIALAQAGIGYAVAPLGTSLTEDQIEELWRLAAEPVLCFDGDAAGLRAAARAIDRALPLLKPGQSLRFALLPAGLDPDDLVRHEGRAALERVLGAALPLSDMIWRTMTESADASTPERRAGLEKAVFDRLGAIGDERVRGFYRREFKDRFFKAFAPRRFHRGNGTRRRPNGPWRPANLKSHLPATRLGRSGTGGETGLYEQLVLLYALNHPDMAEENIEDIAALSVSDPALDKLRADLLVTLSTAQGLDRNGLRAHLAQCGCADIVARLEASPVLKPAWSAWPGATRREADIGWRHVMARLRRLALKREIAAMEAAYRHEASDDTLLRLIELKREFDRSEGTEADIEGYVFRAE